MILQFTLCEMKTYLIKKGLAIYFIPFHKHGQLGYNSRNSVKEKQKSKHISFSDIFYAWAGTSTFPIQHFVQFPDKQTGI